MSESVMPTYGRLNVAFTKGAGIWLFDDKGNKYLDALSGIAVCNLGHSHPNVTSAICEQAGILLHTSNIYQVPLQIELADIHRNDPIIILVSLLIWEVLTLLSTVLQFI